MNNCTEVIQVARETRIFLSMKPTTILRHVGYLDERARVCHTIPHSKSNISVPYLRVMDGDNNEGGVRGKLASCVSYDRTTIIEQNLWETWEEPPAFLSEIQGHLPHNWIRETSSAKWLVNRFAPSLCHIGTSKNESSIISGGIILGARDFA